MRPLRLEYLATSSLPSRAANAIHVMRMCQAWGRLGHAVTLHMSRGTGPAPSAPFEHYGVERVFSLSVHEREPAALASLRRRLPWVRFGPLSPISRGALIADGWSDTPDLLYARHLWWLVGANLRRPDVSFALELHAPPPTRSTRAAVSWLLLRRCCRGLVVISRALERELRGCFPGARLCHAPDAADDPLPAATPVPSGEPARLVVGYVGHLYPGKGGELIVQLAQRCPSFRFEVVGGTEADIARLSGSMPPNLVFAGHRAPAELPDHYRRFDVLLAPYERRVAVHGGSGDVAQWMSPLKLFEYMSWAKPILASDLPVLREILEDDRTALLLPPGETEAWRKALEELARDPDRRARLGHAARERFLTRHTWSLRARSILNELGCG